MLHGGIWTVKDTENSLRLCSSRESKVLTIVYYSKVSRASTPALHTLLFSGGQIILGEQCSRCTCRGGLCSSTATAVAVALDVLPIVARKKVASSRTYLEPPRCIKARPTGLRLERSFPLLPTSSLSRFQVHQ